MCYFLWMAQDLQASSSTIIMLLPETGARADVPRDRAAEAHRRGWVVDVTPGETKIDQGTAATLGATQGATFGFGDELAGAAKAAQALTQGQPVGEAYTHGRDQARQLLGQAETQNPVTFKAAQVAGALPSAVALPGGIVGGATQGALQALGDTKSLADPLQAAKDVGTGAAVGGGIGGALQALGKGAQAAVPSLENAAGKALLSGANLKPSALGAANQGEAVDLAKAALKEPGLVPPVFGKPATAENLAENAAKTKAAAGQALDATYQGLQTKGSPGVSSQQLARDIFDAGSKAALSKPSLRPALLNAVRQVDLQGYDAARAAFARQHGAAAAKAVEASEPWRFVPRNPVDLQGVQQVMNRLKGLGAYPKGSLPSANLLTAKESVFQPGWNAGAEALGNEAQRLGGNGGRVAVDAARDRYGMNAAFEGAGNIAAKQPESVLSSVRDVGGAVLGAAAGHGPGGALLGGAATHIAAKTLPPRAGRAIQNVADSAANGLPWLQKLGGAFGRLFEDKSPEEQIKMDHKLQEISPSYRKQREDVTRALDPSGRVD